MDTQLQSLFDQKHKLTSKELNKLTSDHQHQLIRMVKGTIASPDRTVAMDALVRIAPSSAREVIGEVIQDRETPALLRAVAATQLGRVGGVAAETNLIESFTIDKTPIFQIKVASALGKIGTSKSIDILKRMDKPGNTLALRRQAQLGLILIGFRQHEKIITPPIPKDSQLLLPREGLRVTFKAEPAKKKLLTAVLSDIHLDSYATELSSTVGVRFDCGRNKFTMLLNEKIADREILVEIKRPLVIGLVAQQASVDASWATRYLLLSWPGDGRQFYLSGYRTDGFQVLSGFLTSEDNSGVFDVTAVRDGANTPAKIKGIVRGKNISFTELYAEAMVVGKKYPKEIGPPTDI